MAPGSGCVRVALIATAAAAPLHALWRSKTFLVSSFCGLPFADTQHRNFSMRRVGQGN